MLTVDLTNRCNMMCDPCFMDANQVGYVHELDWDDIKKILDDSANVKPRRQMSVQFSGGEPTLSPHFIDATRYAREVGYFCVQCASNGIRFAQEPEFCQQAKEAGLRLVYLQFDGVTNEANSHRKVGNLFDVKLRAIDNLHKAGIDVVLVVTIVRGVNNDQVGPIVQFAIDNADKITVVSFQPVSFTGRDEDISDELRAEQRYTLSHLAHDMKTQLGQTEPMRDWFPLSAMNPFSDVVDLLMGPAADWGALKCGCHPNCGIGTVLLVHKKTKRMVPVSEFLDVDQLLADMQEIADAGHGKKRTYTEIALAILRNFKPEKAPEGYGFAELVRQFMSQTGARFERNRRDRRRRREVRVALPVRRGHVVPGPVQLRLPPHRDVHHPLRHADGGNQLLRLQHRRRLAEHHREDEDDRDRSGLVSREGSPPRVREEPEAAAPGATAGGRRPRRRRQEEASRRVKQPPAAGELPTVPIGYLDPGVLRSLACVRPWTRQPRRRGCSSKSTGD